MRRAGLAVAVAVALAGVLLLGCEGEDEEAASPRGAAPRTAPVRSGAAPTKASFLRRADALCAEAKRQGAPLADAAQAKIADEDAIGVAAEVRKGIPIADELLTGLRALTPPRGDEAVVGSFLDILAKQKRRIPPLVEALEAEDISGIEVLVPELRRDNERARRLARSYGFTKCAPPALPGG